MNKTKLAVAVLGLALAGVASAVTNTYNGTPFAILDVATVQGTLTVPSTDWSGRRVTTCDVDTAVRLRHTWDSDLVLELKAPTTTTLKLWGGLGGSSDNFNVIIDDEASANISGAVNDGSRRRPQGHPGEAMCWFDGPNPSGVWTMIVSDTVGGDVGTMDAWSVTITGGPDGCESCLPRQRKGGGKGLGSSANNGGGNGDENNPPPGQHGR